MIIKADENGCCCNIFQWMTILLCGWIGVLERGRPFTGPGCSSNSLVSWLASLRGDWGTGRRTARRSLATTHKHNAASSMGADQPLGSIQVNSQSKAGGSPRLCQDVAAHWWGTVGTLRTLPTTTTGDSWSPANYIQPPHVIFPQFKMYYSKRSNVWILDDEQIWSLFQYKYVIFLVKKITWWR